MLKINVTTLDYFINYFLKGELSTEGYIEILKRPFVTNPLILRGQFIGELITQKHIEYVYKDIVKRFGVATKTFDYLNDEGLPETYTCNVDRDTMLSINEVFEKEFNALYHQKIMWEQQLRRAYEIDGERVMVSGIADGLYGNVIIENKTTANYNHEKYAQSVQWQMYLDMFGSTKVQYFIFELFELTAGYICNQICLGNGLNKYPERIIKIKEMGNITEGKALLSAIGMQSSDKITFLANVYKPEYYKHANIKVDCLGYVTEMYRFIKEYKLEYLFESEKSEIEFYG